MRLFVAVEFEPEIKRALADLVAQMSGSRADVKWVEGTNFHLTLYFLGEVTKERVADLNQVLSLASRSTNPFRLEVGGLGAFPSLARPRVLWVGAHGGEALGRLQQRVAEQVQGFAERPGERQPFHPHVTLGRVRSGRGLAELVGMVNELKDRKVGSQEVADFALVESRLYRTGPVYTRVARFALGSD
ncbi:MAG: RNA 2',3'-cyclic phosphodiesterase [Moorellales bacterium]